MEAERKDLKQYWYANLKILMGLLGVWFVVGYILPIFLVEPLNTIRMGGFKLGFWVAQQGAMYVFVALIFVYCALMRKLDREYEVEE